MMARIACVALALIALVGCAAVDVGDYRTEKPVFDLARYFDGTIEGWGMFQDRSGKVVKRFHVRIDAKWEGNIGTLDERFEYADGERQHRVWKLIKDGDRYSGTAADVVGTGTGVAAGNAFNLKYVLALPVEGRVWHVDMDDWMYLIDDRTVLNRTTMSKLGFHVGDVTLAFRKP
jgi:hypothetical protein